MVPPALSSNFSLTVTFPTTCPSTTTDFATTSASMRALVPTVSTLSGRLILPLTWPSEREVLGAVQAIDRE